MLVAAHSSAYSNLPEALQASNIPAINNIQSNLNRTFILVYSFKEDGTYENYAQNPIGLKLSVQGGKGTYSYDGETVTLYHDGKENVFPVKITENSLIIMATDNNPIGDMIYTRVD